MTDATPENRRPLKTRAAGWSRGLARALARAGVSPDLLSALSVVFAALGFLAFWQAGRDVEFRTAWLIAAGAAIQLRLLVNMLDGMVAVEHGRGGPLGPIWNELPDRVADVLFLVGAGYALHVYDPLLGAPLGWLSAVLAVLTAYVRELGRGLGLPADFVGPGAKPHRMFVLTLGCVVGAVVHAVDEDALGVLWLALAVTALLTAVTVVRRTLRLAVRLKA